MPYKCHLPVNGRPCNKVYESMRRLKEHTSPEPHAVLKVVCPFCFKRETTYNRAADLKSHVIKKHYTEVEPVKVPVDALLSENNCYWIAYQPAHYKAFVEPTYKQSDAAVRMRHLLLDWTRKIQGRVQRMRHQWLAGWDVEATVFAKVQSSSQYDPVEPGLYQSAHISMVPGAIYAVLEDECNLYKLKIDDKVLYDARSVASLSRRMAVLKDRTEPEGRYVTQEESSWRPKSGHFSASLGVDETYIVTVERAIKKTKAVTPELEIFAESDIDDGSPPPEERAPIFATSPVKKKLKLDKPSALGKPPVKPVSVSPSSVTVPAASPDKPQGTFVPSVVSIPSTSSASATVSDRGSLATRAQNVLARGCMPLIPPARRHWKKEESLTLKSGEVFCKVAPEILRFYDERPEIVGGGICSHDVC